MGVSGGVGVEGGKGEGRTSVAVDVTVGAGAVAVGNVPGLPALDVGGGGSVVGVAAALGGGEFGGEDPKIGGAGVEVEVESLFISDKMSSPTKDLNIPCHQR